VTTLAPTAAPGTRERSERGPAGRQGPANREDASPYPVPHEAQVGPLWDALREVMDPEIPISLVDMGLIYDVRLEEGTAVVELTYTAIACPCTHFIKWDIAERLQREPGVADIRIEEVWSPAWTKARITPTGRAQMKKWGVSM
jgi:metal-sulfur cluster biosynthetic enzyme